jgi:hypothetical protein
MTSKERKSLPFPSTILCADWAKDPANRAVFLANVSSRVIKRLDASVWSLSAVLGRAARWARRGSVLVTFDVPLGVPESYLVAAGRVRAWQPPASFLEFLEQVHVTPCFFDGARNATDWNIEQPFFSVSPGMDGLKSYLRAANRKGIDLYREIDGKTRAKTLFAKSGIPGSVGTATCALWQELGPRLVTNRPFRIWPFEGEDLKRLLQSTLIVLGEIYPRAAYATALLDGTAESRPRLAVAKTDAGIRCDAIAQLEDAAWVRQHGVTIRDSDAARTSEHDFDACMTAAALLRSVLEEMPLYSPLSSWARAEGGMLGTGAVNLELRERVYTGRVKRKLSIVGGARALHNGSTGNATPQDIFYCPIPGCIKEYRNSRGGWDAHVGSIRIHPNWHPELVSARARKEQFRAEFREFFK